MNLEEMMNKRGFVLPDKSAHQHFTNHPSEFMVSVYPMCDIEKIDDENIHIKSINYPNNKLNPQFRMGITRTIKNLGITY